MGEVLSAVPTTVQSGVPPRYRRPFLQTLRRHAAYGTTTHIWRHDNALASRLVRCPPERFLGPVWVDVIPPRAGAGIDQPFNALAIVPRDPDQDLSPDVVFAWSDFGVWQISDEGESWRRFAVDRDTLSCRSCTCRCTH